MSYQAYLTNIQAKTGKSPADFRALAETKGFTQKGKLAAGVKAGAIYSVNDYDVASRLSFFLWSTPPDKDLLAAASSGELSTVVGLE